MVSTRSSSKRTHQIAGDNDPKPRRRAKSIKPTERSGENEQDVAPPQKRRRVAGSLSLIMTMPIEVFCEIASYSSPEVLLPMARASKALRSLLISKSSKLIWVAAERAIGIPPCPPDLSCPQYASLIFDKFCMNCLANYAKDVNIYTRSRLCRKCEETELSRPDTLPEGMTARDLASLVPGSNLYQIPDTVEWLRIHTYGWFYGQRYYKPLVRRAFREYESMSGDEQLQRDLLIERSRLMHQLWVHSKALESWIKTRKKQREKDIKDLRLNRRKDRLRDLGYTEEDFSTTLDEDGWTWRTLIEQSRELTDKAWITIRPQLEETIHLRKEKRSRVERETCLKQRRDNIRDIARSVAHNEEGKLYLVSCREILLLPAVEKLLNAKGLDSSITESDRQFIKDKIIEIGTKGNREATEFCKTSMMDAFRKCGLLHHDYDKGRKGSNSLLISPSKVLEHNCAFFRDPTSEDYFCPKPFSRIMESDARTSLGTFWSSENDHCGTYAYKTNVPDVQVIMIAKALSENLELSGMSMKELNSLGSVFVCTRCDPLFSQTRDWQSLVLHFFSAEQDYEKARKSVCISRDQKLQSLFPNIHSLKDNTLGNCAVNIQVASSSEKENLILECSCMTCSRNRRRCKKCEVCAMAGIRTYKACERRMRVHINREHSSLPVKALAAQLKLTKLWS